MAAKRSGRDNCDSGTEVEEGKKDVGGYNMVTCVEENKWKGGREGGAVFEKS